MLGLLLQRTRGKQHKAMLQLLTKRLSSVAAAANTGIDTSTLSEWGYAASAEARDKAGYVGLRNLGYVCP